MQTFLPYEDFKKTAEVLDMKRLGKQRVESLQIYNALTIPGKRGWTNHPASQMWKNHMWWLFHYSIEICVEWRRRGYRDSLLPKFLGLIETVEAGSYPPWLGDERLHSSHRANLLRKDATFYGQYGWSENPTMGYYWPTKDV
jgi:hypothetical protein